jgi:hypothetical protein
MAWTDALLSLMPDTVTVKTLSGWSSDGYGVPTYSTGSATYSARIVSEQTMVRTFEGAEELATTTVWVASTSTFGAVDQVTVGGVSPPLLAVETFRDESGVTHSKLLFG